MDERLAGHLERRRTGTSHPVDDFLFTYYRLRPAHLRRWHPGVAVVLVGDPPQAGQRWFTEVSMDGPGGQVRTGVGLDVDAFVQDRGAGLRLVAELLARTATRPARLGCFGLHEWAMAYRLPESAQRHPRPLRLGPRGTDEVVEQHRIVCSHFDAYRFFTPDALSRNALAPTRSTAVELEQPGCLHATMDL